MKKAYDHWNLYSSQTGRISFNSVKSKINADKPMHLGLVGLIGYEDWVSSNGGIQKSVTLTSSDNFTYSLGGGSDSV